VGKKEQRAINARNVKQRANKSSNIVSIIVIISRITGFFRTSTQAWALGAAGLASAYTVANNLPNLLYELVVGGMLITSFLPVYLSVKKKMGRNGASAYVSNLLSIVLLLMVALTVVSFVLAAPIIWTQSAGATTGFDSELAIWFFRWFVVEILLYALSSIISGALNAERSYVASNLAPVFNNLIVIASFVIYDYLVRSMGIPWYNAAIVLAVGNPLGVAVQVICQLPSMRRQGIRLTPRINLRDPALRDTLSIGIPTLVATLASVPTTAVMSSCALSVTEAGASVAYYARIWYMLPYSVFAVPISVTMFTELSASYIAEDMRAFKYFFADGFRKTFFTLVPCSMFLVVFAPSLIAVFAGGQFDGEAVGLTTGYLQALALSLPFYALTTYLQKTCSSMMHMGFFAAATCAASALQIVVCLVLTPLWGLYVVPVSSVFYYGAIDVLVLWKIRSIVGALGMSRVVRSAIIALVFGILGSIVGWLALLGITAIMGPCEGLMRGALYTFVGGVPAVLVTYGATSLLGISDAPFFDSLFTRVFSLLRKDKGAR
jgi:putative peptidoglycan lipid II flippase